ncbi:hypothetical protein FXO38_34323 [Capsicum annuum]|nr:hypothetical protein FXO38_34323 [Capsicum annuum]KAF3623025.1 hypothetical protein FXO37_32069 [Capsicum annuum]
MNAEIPTVSGNDTSNPAQTVAGKDLSNPLTADTLPKNVGRILPASFKTTGTMASGEGSPRASRETKRLQRARNDNLNLLDWDELKALMRKRYVMERYKQEQLTKLYNLRQGDRSVEAAIEVKRNNHAKKTFGWDKSYKPLEKKPFDKTIQRYPQLEGTNSSIPNPKGIVCFKYQGWGHKASECPNRKNIILVKGDPYFVGDKVTKNDVSEGTPQEDNGEYGDPERVVEEGEVNVPCGLMRRTPHDDAWPKEGSKKPADTDEEIVNQFGCESSKLIMVGDRPFTDIVYGIKNGFLTIFTEPLSCAEEPLIVQTPLSIGYLPPTLEDGSLINLFSPFGTIVMAKVVKDRLSGPAPVIPSYRVPNQGMGAYPFQPYVAGGPIVNASPGALAPWGPPVPPPYDQYPPPPPGSTMYPSVPGQPIPPYGMQYPSPIPAASSGSPCSDCFFQ